mmetsp:Transcript_50600/g.126872  ORF Transcript_50600/g.126872 Transcript_50600/m.126872 type:complete len:396 (+) Transcript_50600:3-1190(+)
MSGMNTAARRPRFEGSPLLASDVGFLHDIRKSAHVRQGAAARRGPPPTHPEEFRHVGPACGACAAYMATSVGLTTFNKAIFSTAHFHAAGALCLAQQLLTAVVVRRFGWLGWITLPPLTLHRQWQLMEMSLISVLRIFCGLSSLKYLNVPMHSALLRLSCLFTMPCEYWVFGRIPSWGVVFAAVIMTAGALLAAWGDMFFSAIGVTLILMGVISGSWYSVISKRELSRGHDNEWSLLFYQSCGMSFYLGVWVLLAGEYETVMSYKDLTSPFFLTCAAVNSVLAATLNYFHFMATNHTSAMTVGVCSNFKNTICDVLGVMLFPDIALTPSFTSGIVVSTCGALLYSYTIYSLTTSSNSSSRRGRHQASLLLDKAAADEAESSTSSSIASSSTSSLR